MSSYLQHRRDCTWKTLERKEKVERLSASLPGPFSDEDRRLLALSLSHLVLEYSQESITSSQILHAYGRRAILAHEATNCLADVLVDRAVPYVSPHKPLSGVPVSLKDCVDVAGHDTTVGYSSRVNRPVRTSAPIVRLLRDAGAIIHAKTTVPIGLLSFETTSDLFGETTNPYDPKFSPGASTGGGAALLAYQGSMIEVGTDLGGSTRYPAAYCGLYAVKGSAGRFPGHGCVSCIPGMEAVPAVTSPIARRLEDLREFWKRVVEMRPWDYDHSCIPLPWRSVDFVLAGRKPKWGIIWNDGVIPPTSACVNSLHLVKEVLQKEGHDVVDFTPPSPLEGLQIGYQLMFADGAAGIVEPLRAFETLGPAVRTVRLLQQLPLFVKRLYAWVLRTFSRPFGRNDAWASLLEGFHPKSAAEQWRLTVQREEYRAAWHDAMRAQGVDFILTVPHALPAMPRGGSGVASLVSANYSFLYNVLDYSAGIVPVGFVDGVRDGVSPDFKQSVEYQQMNDIARAVHSLYDAKAMDGHPIAVQIVAGRLEEEKVLEGMKIIEEALRAAGHGFVPKAF